MKDHDKNKKLLYLKYWDVNNLYDYKVSQKLPVNGFKWVENTFPFNRDLKMKKVIKDIFLKIKFIIQKNCINFIFIIFTRKNEYMTLKNMLFT